MTTADRYVPGSNRPTLYCSVIVMFGEDLNHHRASTATKVFFSRNIHPLQDTGIRDVIFLSNRTDRGERKSAREREKSRKTNEPCGSGMSDATSRDTSNPLLAPPRPREVINHNLLFKFTGTSGTPRAGPLSLSNLVGLVGFIFFYRPFASSTTTA